MGRLLRMAIKWGPVIYPIVRKLLADKKQTEAAPRRGKRYSS